jgi:hypothetical protein
MLSGESQLQELDLQQPMAVCWPAVETIVGTPCQGKGLACVGSQACQCTNLAVLHVWLASVGFGCSQCCYISLAAGEWAVLLVMQL